MIAVSRAAHGLEIDGSLGDGSLRPISRRGPARHGQVLLEEGFP